MAIDYVLAATLGTFLAKMTDPLVWAVLFPIMLAYGFSRQHWAGIFGAAAIVTVINVAMLWSWWQIGAAAGSWPWRTLLIFVALAVISAIAYWLGRLLARAFGAKLRPNIGP